MDRPAKILIVDDEKVTLHNYHEILKKHGEVHLAENGSDAVTLAISVQPDIIFLDISLPDFDGFEVIKRLKERKFSPASIVMVTSHDTSHHFIESINAGSSFFLTKPVHNGVLEAVVKSVLYHSDARVKT
ncbi:response regulator transcription factor, partial [Methylophaga sp.]|uniref:response regulator transcription factor n=1 Tax=Methylophaga sp. TaxID=2024840 RepID=UPI003F696F36